MAFTSSAARARYGRRPPEIHQRGKLEPSQRKTRTTFLFLHRFLCKVTRKMVPIRVPRTPIVNTHLFTCLPQRMLGKLATPLSCWKTVSFQPMVALHLSTNRNTHTHTQSKWSTNTSWQLKPNTTMPIQIKVCNNKSPNEHTHTHTHQITHNQGDTISSSLLLWTQTHALNGDWAATISNEPALFKPTEHDKQNKQKKQQNTHTHTKHTNTNKHARDTKHLNKHTKSSEASVAAPGRCEGQGGGHLLRQLALQCQLQCIFRKHSPVLGSFLQLASDRVDRQKKNLSFLIYH